MLKQVTLITNPLEPDTNERVEVEDVRDFLMSRYESFPATGRIYHGCVSLQTDVTPQDEKDIERLGELEGPFYVVIYPEGFVPALLIGFVFAAAAYLLMPSYSAPVPQPPPALARSNQQASSPNNDLSDRANRARINGRIPDIYGTVRSTPDLIAAPYKIFENGREVEYAYMCVGRGQYTVSDIRDGDTLVANIPGSSVMVYGPYTSPNSYDPLDPENTEPEVTIGEQRIVPVLSAKRSNSVNGQVLRPPNAVTFTQAQSQMRFRYPNIIELPEDEDDDFTKYFVEGDVVDLTAVLTTDPITFHVNFKAGNFPLEYSYPGGTKYYPENSQNSRLFFPASFEDLLEPILATDDAITLDTSSVTSIGDIDGTYNVGTRRVVGPTTPEEQAANLPSFYIVDLSSAAAVNPNWNNIVAAVGYDSPITYNQAPFAINLNGQYTIVSVTRHAIVLADPASVNTDWETVLSVEQVTPFMNATISGTGDRWVGPFILEDTELVEVFCNFVAANGLYKDDGTAQVAAEITVEVELTPVGIDDVPLGPAETFTTTLIGSTFLKETVGQTLKCHPSFHGRTAIRCRRITEADTVFDGLVVDEVRWRDAYSIAYVDRSDFGNITSVFAITFATASALAVKERKLNMLAQRKLPSWDGSSFSSEFTVTNDAATILAAVCRDRYIGNRSLAEIDVANFFSVADEVETYFGTARAREFCYTFDKDQLSFEEIVNTIAQAMFCVAYRRGNVIRINFEKATEDSTLLFNHRNKIPGTEKRTVNFGVNQDNDGLQYTYVDPRDDSVATIFLPPDHAAINPKRIDSIGVRNYLQAYFHAWRAWNKLQYQNVIVEFEATQEANLLVVNDRILVADGTRPHSQEGDVLAVDGLQITLSQNVDLTQFSSYSIFLQHYDGTVESLAITPGSAANQVVLSGVPSLPLVTSSEMTARTGYIIVGE